MSKPSYKELVKQPFLARITADNTKEIVKAKIIVPEKYADHPVGKIMNLEEYKWADHLPRTDRYTIKKVEIVENKKCEINRPKKTNKHGYLVMASEGSYSDYENEPYGYSETKEGAQKIANEAVCYGTKRVVKDDDYKGPFDSASIHDLDNMKKVGENNMLWDEIFYYRQKTKPERSYWDKEKRKVVYYTQEEIAEKLKELYDKMIDAKKRHSETPEEKPSEEKEKAESNPKIKYTKEERKKHWEEKHPNQIAKEKKNKEPEPSAEETTKTNWFNNNQKKECEFLWKDE